MFRRKKIVPWFLLPALLCIMLFICSAASASAALVIPARQKNVGAKAYYGDTSLQAVVLQEGIVSIGSQTFMISSIRFASQSATKTACVQVEAGKRTHFRIPGVAHRAEPFCLVFR